MRSEVWSEDKVCLTPAGLGASQQTQIAAQADDLKMKSFSSYIKSSLDIYVSFLYATVIRS